MENTLKESLYNLGSGEEITIKELALLIQEIVSHKGEIFWDKSKPDGTPRKLLESEKFKNLGWESIISLNNGIKMTYSNFIESNLL